MYRHGALTQDNETVRSKANYEYRQKRCRNQLQGAQGMPWLTEAKKDAISCEKLWGAASKH
jgi:hypothetical protein